MSDEPVPPGIWRFYGRLLWKAPHEFRGAWEVVFWVVAVALLVLTTLSRPLAERASLDWNGINPWWTLAVVFGLAAARMARNNYTEFAILHSRVTTEELARQRRRQIRHALQSVIAEGIYYERKCLEKDGNGLNQQAEMWEAKCHQVFFTTLSDEGFDKRLFAATEAAYVPDATEMRYHNMVADEFMRRLRWLRAKRQVVEDCLRHYPPLD